MSQGQEAQPVRREHDVSFERSHDAKVDDEGRAVQLRLVPLLSGDPMAGLNLLEAFVRERPLPLDIRWDVLDPPLGETPIRRLSLGVPPVERPRIPNPHIAPQTSP